MASQDGPTSLKHIYFFLDNNATSADPSAHERDQLAGANAAAWSNHSSSRDSSVASTSGSMPLSPTAPPFMPLPQQKAPHLTAAPATLPAARFEARPIPGKGIGLVATTLIRRGERIICEPPLLYIRRNELHLVWEQYQRLDHTQKIIYDTLYGFEQPSLNLSLASRMHLADTWSGKSAGDDDAVIKEQVRVMKIFAVNNFLIANGCYAVFAHASRLNHSCIPNVFHCYNPNLQKETVHATRDIVPGEELVTNYLGEMCHSSTRLQRWAKLRPDYNFTCQCPACSDRTTLSDTLHELFGAILWGIQQYCNGFQKGDEEMIPEDAIEAQKMAEDALRLLLQQKLFGIELAKAYRLASELALESKAMDKAIEHAYNEQTVELTIMGVELDDLKEAGTASECWIEHVRGILEANNYQICEELQRKLKLKHKIKDEKPKIKTAKKKKKHREVKQTQENQSEE